MDEQRLQAYYQLIQQLLSCSNGEEAAILQANRELLDVGFLADFDTYLQFLSEVLQATAESRGNPQVVYPLLAANTDKLNLTFVELLRLWATNTLEEAEPDTANSIAVVIGNFSNLIQQFPLGNKADNMEIAITGYEIAFTVFTRTDFPEDWAMTQNNLGTAYRDRIRGDKADNLENAIAAYQQALEVRTRTDFPVDWAMTQNNLGNAYSNKIRGDKADNLEIAIAAYNAALEVYTPADFPVQWAATQNNLGTAYSDRIRGDKADNLEDAIAAYNAALEVRTRTDFPVENAQTLLNLGIAYQYSQQLNLAYDTFKSAIATVEGLRGEIISGEESKRKQAEKWNKLFVLMVEVCLGLGKEREAISYIERSKTRNLVELIAKKVGFNPIQYPEIQNLLDDKTAIIQFYIFKDCFRAFIITKNNDKPIIWKSTKEDLHQLRDWVYDEYLKPYYLNRKKWQNDLNDQLTKLAKILHINQIIAQVPKHIQKIIIIPHRYLHLLPFHALPVPDSYLMDLFPQGVGYAPSCQLLQQTQLRQRDDFQSLFAIQTPTEDLYEEDLGAVAAIKKQFDKDKSHVLKNENAKKSAIIPNNQTLNTANNLFFFCHGSFNSNCPLDSGLQLADEVLTLEDIITHLKLENCRLVTLAACETGMTDFTNTSDEYIGLSSGFLLAGSTNVVSSLWTVSTRATALLMVRFYQELKYQELKHENNLVLALQTAQRWLRDTNIRDFKQWLKTSSLTFAYQSAISKYFDRIEQNHGENYQPFSSPVDWSAFCCIGKGV